MYNNSTNIFISIVTVNNNNISLSLTIKKVPVHIYQVPIDGKCQSQYFFYIKVQFIQYKKESNTTNVGFLVVHKVQCSK